MLWLMTEVKNLENFYINELDIHWTTRDVVKNPHDNEENWWEYMFSGNVATELQVAGRTL